MVGHERKPRECERNGGGSREKAEGMVAGWLLFLASLSRRRRVSVCRCLEVVSGAGNSRMASTKLRLSVGTALDVFWMSRALRLAREAASAGEIPVGAVVVVDGWRVVGVRLSLAKRAPAATISHRVHHCVNAARLQP